MDVAHGQVTSRAFETLSKATHSTLSHTPHSGLDMVAGGLLGTPFGTYNVQAPPLTPRTEEEQDPTLDAQPVRQQKPS